VNLKKSATILAGVVLALGMAAPAFADTGAEGAALTSPGVVSGNVVQVPVNIPVNLCGNTVDVIGALNPTLGAGCANDD
jgi:hypothetical protein